MKKCDWCKHSELVDGELCCSADWCMLSQEDILKILKYLRARNK